MRFKASWVTILLFVALLAVAGVRVWRSLHPPHFTPHMVHQE